MTTPTFNRHGVWAIYKFEMARALRTVWQSLVTPVITTSLYFVVFGSAIGSRMIEVRVGHRRVLALNVHAADFAGVGRVDDLDHGEAGFSRQRRMPQLFVLPVDLLARNVGIIRIKHRNETRIGSALHIVLSPQRVQSGARPAHLPAHQRKGNEATRIVGPVYVL